MREELIDLASVEDTEEESEVHPQNGINRSPDRIAKNVPLDQRYEDAWKNLGVTISSSSNNPMGDFMRNKAPQGLLPGTIIPAAPLINTGDDAFSHMHGFKRKFIKTAPILTPQSIFTDELKAKPLKPRKRRRRKSEMGSDTFEPFEISSSPYKRPRCKLHEIIYIILYNSPNMEFNAIWDFISGLFPYFAHSWSQSKGVGKLVWHVNQNKLLFIKNKGEFDKKPNYSLNPASIDLQMEIHSSLEANEENIKEALIHSEYFEDLMKGNLFQRKLDLFQRPREESYFGERKSRESDLPPPPPYFNYPPPPPYGSHSIPSHGGSEISPLIKSLHAHFPPEGLPSQAACSSESDSFQPKIDNCMSIPGLEMPFQDIQRNSDSISPNQISDSPTKNNDFFSNAMFPLNAAKALNTGLSEHQLKAAAGILANKTLTNSDTFKFFLNMQEQLSSISNDQFALSKIMSMLEDPNSASINLNLGEINNGGNILKTEASVSNGVGAGSQDFSTFDINKPNEDVKNDTESNGINIPIENLIKPDSSVEIHLPEVEKCVPLWESKFPWVKWVSSSSKVSCRICEKLLKKIDIIKAKKFFIVKLTEPGEVFKVSGSLRIHADKDYHKIANTIINLNIVERIHQLKPKTTPSSPSPINNFPSLVDAKELLLDHKTLGDTNDSYFEHLFLLGEFVEDQVIMKLKAVDFFSIKSDPCSGLLIVRLLNDNDVSCEHIISSYMSSYEKSPIEHLEQLGINVEKIAFASLKSPCNNCKRCSLYASRKGSSRAIHVPLQIPEINEYLSYLWDSSILKPFYFVGCGVVKLMQAFPFKFKTKFPCGIDELRNFPRKPGMLGDVFQNMDEIKTTSEAIYNSTGSMDALAVMNIEVDMYLKYSHWLPIIGTITPALQSILTQNTPQNIQNLNLTLDKFREVCECYKELNTSTEIGHTNADVDSLFLMIELTVNEYQHQIYHKGADVMELLSKFLHYDLLVKNKTNPKLYCLFEHLLVRFPHAVTDLIDALIKFFSLFKKFEGQEALSVVAFFSKNSVLKSEHVIVYDFYRLVALFPFQSAKYGLSLYGLKVMDLLYDFSDWVQLSPSIKENLFSILCKLKYSQISDSEVRDWWLGKLSDAV